MLNSRITYLALACLPIFSCSLALADQTLLWSEEFNGTGEPNPAVWSYDLGNLGVNQELQTYTNDPDNVRVEGGNLVITARRESSLTFTSGRIRTQDKIMFQYGTIEARIKIPDLAQGLWPAFWTLGNDISSVGWPKCGEIDVMEMGAGAALADGQVNRRAYSTVHWDIDGNYASYGGELTTNEELNDDFHIWRMEWTPNVIMTFVDDEYAWAIDISNPDAFGGHEFHAPHFFIINLAIGGNFTGLFNPNSITAPLPAEYLIDYVRIYDNGHTILDGPGLIQPCPGDVTDDGTVDAADLGILLALWNTNGGTYGETLDINGDGTINASDIGLMLSVWGDCP